LRRVVADLIEKTGGSTSGLNSSFVSEAMSNAVIQTNIEYGLQDIHGDPAAISSPREHFLAVFAACAAVRTLNNISTPATFPEQTSIGTVDYTRGCAFRLATVIADVDDQRCPEATSRFLGILDEHVKAGSDEVPKAIWAGLLSSLKEFRRPTTDPLLADPPKRTLSRRIAAIPLVLLLVGGLTAAWWMSTRSDPGPEVPPTDQSDETFNAAVLSNVSIKVSAYPVGGRPTDDVHAIPEHPPRGFAIVNMGQWLQIEIEIRLRNQESRNPDEHYYLGFWPTAYMSVRHGTSTVEQHGHPAEKVPDLTATPISIDDPDSDGSPIVYRVQIAAVPLLPTAQSADANGYMCGFNSQAVNAILSSSSHPDSVITSLPVYVRRPCP